ncbi:MAG: HU family DNA-binding protein [Oscillospiraceae bacterium]|nr:HU family DNA-binding protein [Oscillospiraceae bacterium]
MNKADLINAVADKTGLTKKDCEKAISGVFDAISESLVAGEKVQLVGFGAFDVKARAPRMGRNPKTKESIQIPASQSPVFKAGKALKEAIVNSQI